jgi:hypothetical protein
MTNYREYLSGMLAPQGWGTPAMFALDEVLQAEIVDLDSPQVIPFFDKQVVKDEGVRIYERSQAVQDDIDAEIFKRLFFNALNEDLERSGLFKKRVKESKPKKEGRNKPVKIKNLRGAKPGWKMAEGSNFWTVNEKDPYWKTKVGFREVMDLYGVKPSWVKEPSLEYNPTTGEYDTIVKEEFVSLQPTKRISL